MGWFLPGALAVAIIVCLVIGVTAIGELIGLLMDAISPDD